MSYAGWEIRKKIMTGTTTIENNIVNLLGDWGETEFLFYPFRVDFADGFYEWEAYAENLGSNTYRILSKIRTLVDKDDSAKIYYPNGGATRTIGTYYTSSIKGSIWVTSTTSPYGLYQVIINGVVVLTIGSDWENHMERTGREKVVKNKDGYDRRVREYAFKNELSPPAIGDKVVEFAWVDGSPSRDLVLEFNIVYGEILETTTPLAAKWIAQEI